MSNRSVAFDYFGCASSKSEILFVVGEDGVREKAEVSEKLREQVNEIALLADALLTNHIAGHAVTGLPNPFKSNDAARLMGATCHVNDNGLLTIDGDGFRVVVVDSGDTDIVEDRQTITVTGDVQPFDRWMNLVNSFYFPTGYHLPIAFWPRNPPEDWVEFTVAAPDHYMAFERASLENSFSKWGYRSNGDADEYVRTYYFSCSKDAMYAKMLT